jgi:hypothetical protein
MAGDEKGLGEELETLARLREEGALTDEKFFRAKTQLLGAQAPESGAENRSEFVLVSRDDYEDLLDRIDELEDDIPSRQGFGGWLSVLVWGVLLALGLGWCNGA